MSEKAKKLDYFLLLPLGAVFIYFQCFQLSYDPIGDANILGLQNSLKYYLVLLKDPGQLGRIFTEFPPLVYLFSSGFYALAGFSLPVAYLSSLCFIFLLVFAVYGLGLRFGGRRMAWILLFLTLANPRTLFWSKFYTLNFPEMAILALIFYLLFTCEEFSSPRNSSLFGLFLGLGILTRYAQVFLCLPLLWIFLVLSKREFSKLKRTLLCWGSLLGLLALLKFGGNLIFHADGSYWFKDHFYFLQGLTLILLLTLWFFWKKHQSRFSPLVNFTLALSSSILLILPWQFATQDIFVPYLSTYFKTYFPDPDSFLRTVKIFLIYAGYNFPGAGLAIMAGITYALFKIKKTDYQILLLGGLGGILMMSVLIVDPAYRYFLALLPLITLLAIIWLKNLPKAVGTIALVLSMIWFFLNLAGFNLMISHKLNAYPEFFFWGQKLLYLTHYPKSTGETLINVEDIDFIGLDTPTLKNLCAAIKREFPAAPKKGINILFLNRIPGLMVHNGQLETLLLAEKYVPGGDFSPEKLKEQWIFLKEFLQASPRYKLPAGYRENPINFNPRLPGKNWDFLLIADQTQKAISVAQRQIESGPFNLKLLDSETIFRPTFRQLYRYQINFYRMQSRN